MNLPTLEQIILSLMIGGTFWFLMVIISESCRCKFKNKQEQDDNDYYHD